MRAYGERVVPGGYTGHLDEFLLAKDYLLIPVTIDRASGRFSGKMKAPVFYGRQSASPGKYAPFFMTALLASDAAAAQKDIILATAGEVTIASFKIGDDIMVMAGSSWESRTIHAIDVATNKITLTANLTTAYATAANAKVYLTDGTEKSADVVIIEDEIDFAETSDVIVSGYQKGSFHESKIGRRANFVKKDCSRLDIREPQL